MKLPRALFFLFLTLPAFGAIAGPVTTAEGLVAGTAGAMPEVRVFKGIPFAAPPVGDLRWRAPQPVAKWDGVRAADRFSANCVQRQAGGGAFPPNGGDRSATEMSEDCLYLNVYTAAKSAGEKRPVMVWIHGGAWVSGAGAIYEGEELARKGVVMVTVNYRMGPFGFLAHPELSKESGHGSGNYAILDQIAGLRWVQKNIAAFGGDPKRVTIFGESAGSWSVNFLIASPLGKGLFQRGIGESGGEFAPTRGLFEPAVALSDAEQVGIQFGEFSKLFNWQPSGDRSSFGLVLSRYESQGLDSLKEGWGVVCQEQLDIEHPQFQQLAVRSRFLPAVEDFENRWTQLRFEPCAVASGLSVDHSGRRIGVCRLCHHAGRTSRRRGACDLHRAEGAPGYSGS